MIWVAFTLGLFGSLHCIGMCGPLAWTVAGHNRGHWFNGLFQSLQYNGGRVLTYAIMGALLGLVGEVVMFSDLQKVLSILAGSFLIILFIFSLDIEKILLKSRLYNKWFSGISSILSSLLQKGAVKYPFLLGMVNGVLPCGLVYLALTGSLVSGGISEASFFMTAFGLGTFPVMVGIMILGQQSSTIRTIKKYLPRIFQAAQLALGVFLIYRGIMVDLPEELNFWVAVKNPVMCH